VGNSFRWGIQHSITKGKIEEAVNMLYGMIKRAGRKMVTKTRQYTEGNYWYDEQCKKRRERLS
jgi:hypothetical protein